MRNYQITVDDTSSYSKLVNSLAKLTIGKFVMIEQMMRCKDGFDWSLLQSASCTTPFSDWSLAYIKVL